MCRVWKNHQRYIVTVIDHGTTIEFIRLLDLMDWLSLKFKKYRVDIDVIDMKVC